MGEQLQTVHRQLIFASLQSFKTQITHVSITEDYYAYIIILYN